MVDVDADENSAAKRSVLGRLAKVLAALLVVLAIGYVAAASYMYINQRSFVFVPSGELETPEDKGLKGILVETVTLADGTNVPVWTAEATKSGAPTVLYFHGNSKSVSARWERFKAIVESGYGLYAPGYRGYPGAGGEPSETAFVADAIEHFDRLAEKQKSIILHGESLGTGVATAVAEVRPEAHLLVLEAPYTALVDMAHEQYPWLPVELLMKDPMKSRERIQNVSTPVLILHGTEDRVIPLKYGQRLFEFANAPKEMLVIDGATHSNLWDNGLWEAVMSTYDALGHQ